MAVPKVIVIVPPGSGAPPLEAVSDEAEITVVRTAEELRAAQPGVEIMFLNHYRTELLREVGPGDLRWIHTSSIGVDALLTEEIIEKNVVVTVSRGVCERPIAEWVLAVLLMFVKDLRRTIELQRSAEWQHRETEGLEDRRVLLLGFGLVGRETAKLLRVAGMKVDIVASRARKDTEMGQIHAIEDLDDFLSTADDLVLALPLTDETTGIIDSRRLDNLRQGARLINVGRGPLVDEEALLGALHRRHLGGAALDVFAQEPLPFDHPFWTMDNVLVSPHMSGDLIGWRGRVVERFATNLRHWLAGEPLVDVVDLRQYAEATSSADEKEG